MKRACLIGITFSLGAALTFSACGGTVDGGSNSAASGTGTGGGTTGTSGSNGTASMTGSTGAGGMTGSTGAGSMTGSGGGAACSAPADCASDEVCDFPDDLCGTGAKGTCIPRPQVCPEDCPGVCGCDGMKHCNGCIAHSQGVDVSKDATCGAANGQYSAYLWLGGLDHMMLYKADKTRNLCFVVYLDSPTQNSPNFNVTLPMSWGVSNAVVTDNAMDCVPNQPSMGQTVSATSGMGTIAWMVDSGKYYPCTVDFHLSLAFAGAPAWVPPSEPLDADKVTLQGGCL